MKVCIAAKEKINYSNVIPSHLPHECASGVKIVNRMIVTRKFQMVKKDKVLFERFVPREG